MAAGFDVQAATDAWLARLPAAERLAAQAATDARLIGWIAGVLVFLAAAALVTRLGLVAQLTKHLETGGQRPWLASAAAAAVTALALASAKAVVDATTAWRVEAILAGPGGAAATGWPAHLAAAVAGVPTAVVAAILILPPSAWLMRRAPRRWPLIVGPTALALILALGWLPYALSVGADAGPAPPGPAQAGVARLVAETQLPAPAVTQAANPGLDADVTGGFGHARVVVGPRLLAGPPAEARAYVGHLIGHYAHNDILFVCLVLGAVAWAGCWAAQAWTAPLARAMGATQARGPADPTATPALAVIGAATVTLAALAGAAYLRWANVGADAYSLEHAREPDGLVAVIEDEWGRDRDRDSATPSALETVLFYSHPSLKDRIAHATAWKAAHPG